MKGKEILELGGNETMANNEKYGNVCIIDLKIRI